MTFRAAVDPPSAPSPNATARASTRVDLPEPFSPTSTVAPSSAQPSRSTWATAGTRANHSASGTGPPSRRIRRTGSEVKEVTGTSAARGTDHRCESCTLVPAYCQEDSPSGLWRTLGKRVG